MSICNHCHWGIIISFTPTLARKPLKLVNVCCMWTNWAACWVRVARRGWLLRRFTVAPSRWQWEGKMQAKMSSFSSLHISSRSDCCGWLPHLVKVSVSARLCRRVRAGRVRAVTPGYAPGSPSCSFHWVLVCGAGPSCLLYYPEPSQLHPRWRRLWCQLVFLHDNFVLTSLEIVISPSTIDSAKFLVDIQLLCYSEHVMCIILFCALCLCISLLYIYGMIIK